MNIAPIDVAHKNFTKKMMGYSQDEVNEFLKMVSSQLEELVRERNSLKETLREKELSLLEYKEKDEVIKETIKTAGQMAERINKDAEREAKLIISDAEQKGEIIIKDARDSLRKTYREIGDLKKMKIQFEANLRSLIQAHLSILEDGDKFAPEPAPMNALNFQELPQEKN